MSKKSGGKNRKQNASTRNPDRRRGKQESSKRGAEQPSFDRPDFCVSPRLPKNVPVREHAAQLLPVVVFTAFIIAVSRMHQYDSRYGSGLFYWADLTGTQTDFYYYWKSVAVCVCGAAALAFLAGRWIAGTLWVRRTRLYIPMAAYAALTALSAAFSEHGALAWWGADGKFGGGAVLLCYLVLLFYTVNTLRSERGLRWVLYPLTAVVSVLALLGASQAAGHDFFRTALGQKLLVPNAMTASGQNTWQIIDALAARGETALGFVFDSEIYQTVGNPNYVAFYLPLLLPVYGLLLVFGTGLKKKCVWGAVYGLLAFNLLSAGAIGGLFGALCALAVVLLCASRGKSGHKAFFRPVLALAGITAVAAALSFPSIASELAYGVEDALDRKIEYANRYGAAETEQRRYERPVGSGHKFDYVYTDADGLRASLDGTAFVLGEDPVLDAGVPEGLSVERGRAEGGASTITLKLDGEERVWLFARTDTGWKYENDLGNLVSLHVVPRVGDDRYAAFGTGRGYLWSRTAPMLSDAVVLGYGPDTFALYFPQDDYIGKYNSYWNVNAIIDKPHSLYLGIAFGTGLLSLAAFLALAGMYLAWSWRLYRRRGGRGAAVDGLFPILGRGIFAGVCGFLAVGMFYDGMVSVMPLFYGMLGVGVVCNFANREPGE
jgi:hypothetical protein